MSIDRDGSRAGAEPDASLYHLLKHAQLRLARLTGNALEPHGVTGRELTVLRVLAGHEPASQQQAAQHLGVDRTTMVGLLDELEAKGLVARRPDAEDRRRNVVALTAAGQAALRAGSQAAAAAEGEFLAPLPGPAARRLKDALRQLIQAGDQPGHVQAKQTE
jgi:DNA-binding MarR family transcriptional regulator